MRARRKNSYARFWVTLPDSCHRLWEVAPLVRSGSDFELEFNLAINTGNVAVSTRTRSWKGRLCLADWPLGITRSRFCPGKMLCRQFPLPSRRNYPIRCSPPWKPTAFSDCVWTGSEGSFMSFRLPRTGWLDCDLHLHALIVPATLISQMGARHQASIAVAVLRSWNFQIRGISATAPMMLSIHSRLETGRLRSSRVVERQQQQRAMTEINHHPSLSRNRNDQQKTVNNSRLNPSRALLQCSRRTIWSNEAQRIAGCTPNR